MKPVFYSEVLKKYFEDKEACEKAEAEYNEKHALEIKKKEERTKRAKEVEEAYANYIKLRDEFVKDYKEYHMTYRDTSDGIETLFDYFFKI